MDTEKRIYSMNTAAYLIMATGIEPQYAYDSTDEWKVYFVFPETEDVEQAIKEYRATTTMVNLHMFLNCFNKLKENVKKLQRLQSNGRTK